MVFHQNMGISYQALVILHTVQVIEKKVKDMDSLGWVGLGFLIEGPVSNKVSYITSFRNELS